MSTQAIIYDLDGTLVDTLADIGGAMNSVLQRNGFTPLSIEEYSSRVGWGVTVLVRKSLPPEYAAHDVLVARLADEMREAYGEKPVVHSRLFPGIEELLKMVDGYPDTRQMVLSNKPDVLVQPIVQTLFGSDRFDLVRGARPDRPSKPDPATTIEMLGEVGISPNRTLFIGDSEVDMETARHAGCTAVGVTWGFRAAETVQAGGAEYMMYSVSELHQFIYNRLANGRSEQLD